MGNTQGIAMPNRSEIDSHGPPKGVGQDRSFLVKGEESKRDPFPPLPCDVRLSRGIGSKPKFMYNGFLLSVLCYNSMTTYQHNSTKKLSVLCF